MSTTAPSATTTTTVSTASSSALDSVAELRLIPEFGGKPSESVSEWLEKVDLVCNLRGLCKPETVIPLRLTDGAFAVYQQLSATDKSDLSKIKSALLTSFGVDAFTAYEQFVSRKIMPNESVDVYLSQLKLLSSHFGGASDKTLACAFVAGLPDEVKQLLRASSRMETLTLIEILARARAILTNGFVPVAAAQAISPAPKESRAMTVSSRLCFECHQPNHMAKDCLLRRGGPGFQSVVSLLISSHLRLMKP